MMAVLIEIAEALECFTTSKEAGRLVAHLAKALEQLDEGIVDPALAPKKLHHKAPLPDAVWRQRALLALYVEILCGAKLSVDEACRIIARVARPEINALRTAKPGRSDVQTLSNWVANLRGGVAVPQDIAALYARSRPTAFEQGRGKSAADAERIVRAKLKSGFLFSPRA
jgi:hypothetical protein